MTNTLKFKGIGLILLIISTLGCSSDVNGPDKQGDVVLSSPTVEPEGSLSLNAKARFDANITGLEENPPLIYEWSLKEARGMLIVEDQDRGFQVQSTNSYVTVRGDKAGKETLRVKVLNKETGDSLGGDTLAFEITVTDGDSKCFDEPLLFFRNANWFSPVVTAIGLESDTRKVNTPPTKNLLMDISPDGNWFLRQDFSDRANYAFWLDACDGSENRLLAEGLQINSPTFGPMGKFVYYTALIDYPEQTQDPRAQEVMRINIETGNKEFISDFRVFSKTPNVSPDGKWIAFEHGKETFDDNGSYAGSIIHLAVMPSDGGPARFLVPIVDGRLGGIDWSPDSKDIIFYFNEFTENNGTLTEGIYRIYLDGGSTPSLLFSEGKGSAVREIAYYANGDRIAFEGHPAGNDTRFDIWNIDANGNDLQRLTDEQYDVFLSFIWEPE
jgi:hypothetical protein